jgi:hypothetical protein
VEFEVKYLQKAASFMEFEVEYSCV